MIPYNELEKHFIKPKNWTPNKQSFYGDRFKRYPRKLKKAAKKNGYTFLDLEQNIWYLLHTKNKDYTRFLIKLIVNEKN